MGVKNIIKQAMTLKDAPNQVRGIDKNIHMGPMM